MFYTYVWKDSSGSPFYVGKGKGRRAGEVYPYRRSKEFMDVYARGGCAVEIVGEFAHESDAHVHEIELIDKYGKQRTGGVLVNKTSGGQGQSGRVVSEETKRKLRAAHLGRELSIEHRSKIGDAHRGNSLSPEWRSNISEGRKGMVFSDEHRANIGKASTGNKHWLGKKHKPSTLEALRVIHGARSEATCAAISAALSGKPLSDGHKEKIGRGLRMAPPSSGFKGVGFDKSRSKWVAKIKLDGKTVNLGRFKDHEDAARAYDAAAIKAWGLGNCYLNFPLDEADDLIARPN